MVTGYSSGIMDSLKSAIPKRFRLASVPLVVAYGAVPLGMAAVRAADGILGTVSVMMPWLLLTALGTLLAMRDKSEKTSWKKFAFKATCFMLLIIGLFLYQADLNAMMASIIPYISEASPLIFLLFSLLWAYTCGMPDRGDFQRFGALLGTFCLIDFVVEILVYGTIPTVRWIGNADLLAGMLLIALCASLKPGGNEGGRYEPDQGHPLWRILIKLAILTCLSRTGLFAAAWVVLCFGRGSWIWRVGYAVACAALLGMSFFLPATASDAIRYADYWLWVEALRLFSAAPDLLLTGFPVTAAIPIDFPATMAAIWRAATGQSHELGVFLYHIPSFWLRLTMAWGGLAPLLLLATLFALLGKRLTRMGAGLTAGLFAQGMTTPLFYDPAMSVTICLAFILAFSTTLHPHDVKPKPVRDPEPVLNPAEEWDFQPK